MIDMTHIDLWHIYDISTPPTGVIPNYIPELERSDIDPHARAIVLSILNTHTYETSSHWAHDAIVSIQSVGKVLLYAYALEKGIDPEQIADTEAVWLPFNQDPVVSWSTPTAAHPLNNAWGISSASEVDDRDHFLEFVRRCCNNETIDVLDPIYQSEKSHRENNLKLSAALASVGRFDLWDIEKSLDIYTKTCSLWVSCDDLLYLWEILMTGGKDRHGTQHLSSNTVVRVLNAMSSFGLYDETGRMTLMITGTWALHAKSGVSGLVLTVIPGVCTYVTLWRHLDHGGNSVFGMLSGMHIYQHIYTHIYPNISPDRTSPHLRLDTAAQEALIRTYLDEARHYTKETVLTRLISHTYCLSSCILSPTDIQQMKDEATQEYTLLTEQITSCFL